VMNATRMCRRVVVKEAGALTPSTRRVRVMVHVQIARDVSNI
jgi:hypothetical protein